MKSIILAALLALTLPLEAAEKCRSCPRTSHGRITRSQSAKCAFLKSQGYTRCRVPAGYVVDHIVPLACGGRDSPSNMQLQTKAAAKAKDRWETKGCTK